MSEAHDPSQSPYPPPPPEQQPPMVIPVRYPMMQPPPRPARGSLLGSLFRTFLFLVLALSLGVNFVLLFGGRMAGLDGGTSYVNERIVSGPTRATNKIAIVKLDGVIMEGAIGFVQKEIDQAAMDEHVKAVILRINSPGGSITASDDLHRRIKQLADGTHPKQKGGKKNVIVSMGALAASGGYYVAAPAEYIFAEQTTITGSIGVYAAFPNISGLADKYGFGMNVIKAGEIKDSGSMFHNMTAQERQLWQDMVNHAYKQFIAVVEAGRPKLAGQMTVVIPETKREIEDVNEKGKVILVDGKPKMVEFYRKRADGGIFTADEAFKFGLIDKIGYQEDAVKKAKEVANLDDNTKVVTYERPPTLANLLLGAEADPPNSQLNTNRLPEATMPRLWFMAPQSELSGILSTMTRP
ncbi:MAG: S49 family peptidase [Gemmataceae bacterium]|nr:S49 family peptidase [Gemmataceae bacterium]